MSDTYELPADQKAAFVGKLFGKPKGGFTDTPLESVSTTLFPRGWHQGRRKWYVESNTSEGLKRLQATELDTDSDYDVQSSEPAIDLDALIEKLVFSARSRTRDSSSAKSFWRLGKVYDVEMPPFEGVLRFTDVEADEDDGGDAQSEFVPTGGTWTDVALRENEEEGRQSTGNVLQDLEHAEATERRQLIIEAEAVPFEGQERQRLIVLLKDYIEENRDSTDRNELIAVGSAIRKCVALLDSSEFGWLATLLESGHRVQPSLDAELEIAKMVFRRYSVSPPEQSDPHPQLSARLGEIASDYLRPRVFSRERFSTVAMLAIQSLLVMRSAHAQPIIEQVNELPFGWFRQQLRRRMARTVHSMGPDAAGVEELGAIVQRIRPE